MEAVIQGRVLLSFNTFSSSNPKQEVIFKLRSSPSPTRFLPLFPSKSKSPPISRINVHGGKSRIAACSKGRNLDDENCASNINATSANKEASFDLKLPRRNLIVQFTCNECGERTQRTINRVAYERGTVFVQCAGCLVNHKLVDNLGLVVEYDLRNELDAEYDGSN